jgi:Ca2+-binding EF-hand superfamily protein
MTNRHALSRLLLILGLASAGAGQAMGQEPALDSDGDGRVSYPEMLVAMPELSEEEFAALDADGDGGLDAEELAAAEAAGLIPAG